MHRLCNCSCRRCCGSRICLSDAFLRNTALCFVALLWNWSVGIQIPIATRRIFVNRRDPKSSIKKKNMTFLCALTRFHFNPSLTLLVLTSEDIFMEKILTGKLHYPKALLLHQLKEEKWRGLLISENNRSRPTKTCDNWSSRNEC